MTQLVFERVEWLFLTLLVGLHAPGQRGWSYFPAGRGTLTTPRARAFAADLESALRRLPDADGDEDALPLTFPACMCSRGRKGRAHDLAAFARQGAFSVADRAEGWVGVVR